MSQTSIAHSAHVAQRILGCAFSNELPQVVNLFHPAVGDGVTFMMTTTRGVCEWAQSWGQKVHISRTGIHLVVETRWYRAVDSVTVRAFRYVDLHTTDARVLGEMLGHPETNQVAVKPGRLMAALRGVAA